MLDDSVWLSALAQAELALKAWSDEDTASTRTALARVRLLELARQQRPETASAGTCAPERVSGGSE